MHRGVGVAILWLLVVAGCARSSSDDLELRAACGSVVFSEYPPSLDEFPPIDADAASAVDVLANAESAFRSPGVDTAYDWSIASRTDEQLLLFGRAVGPDDRARIEAQFTWVGDHWSPQGVGPCSVLVDAPGFGPAGVALDPARAVDPASTDLPLRVNENQCASGEAPNDRDVIPVVTETDESVTVVVLVEPVPGSADCPPNPWHPISVTLDKPLGDRAVFDGGGETPRPLVSSDGDG